jgi:hypothetical protein
MRAGGPRSDAEDAYRAANVLDLLIAQILEGEIEYR